MKSVSKPVFMLILCAFFWGSCFPFGKEALQQVHAYTLVMWRFVIAAICLGIYIKFSRISFGKMSARQWLIAIGVSVIGVGGLNIGLFTGLASTSSTNGALIMALSPLTTSIIACFVHRQFPTRVQVVSLIVSLCGVGLVITNGSYAVIRDFAINNGDILIFSGMLCWSFYTFASQSISRWMPVIPYTFLGMCSGFAVIGGLCLFSGSIHPVDELFSSSVTGILEVVYIGLFGTVAGYLLWLSGVKTLGASTASLFFNFVPVFSVLVSVTIGQAVTSTQLLGMGIVIIGLLIPRLLTLRLFWVRKLA
ncbi:DMT family transporter [Vibrio salinus]|uniref:DMT family transporter n=1 Tax=Vibrio salinus TaxID=2899784 RepID=UPI001E549817|nr:DMT family transporter [Vibrio salinus]MCE0494682.1 DMT family transporter [Vibrio salinus]